MTIGITVTGNESATTKALLKMRRRELLHNLHVYGQRGVDLLRNATPVETSITANSWHYRIVEEKNGPRVEWYNTHGTDSGMTSVAVLIQYGYGTKNGGYVQGRDYINPAIQPMFDEIISDIWEKVRR